MEMKEYEFYVTLQDGKGFKVIQKARTISEAKQAAGGSGGYWWHWKLAMKEVVFLFGIMLGSIVHAFIPWVLDFKLLEWRINRLKKLKTKLPNDPQLQKVHFDE